MNAMMKPSLALTLIIIAAPALASDAVRGTETTFGSPNGITERCVRIPPVPGGVYDNDDLEQEAAYCAIDLYAADTALCPKTWSTSPAALVYDLVDVFMRKGETTDYIQNRPFDVVGVFHIGDSIVPGELYSMDDAVVIDR